MEPKTHHFFSLNTALCTVQVRFLKKDCTRFWLPETRFAQDSWYEIVIRSPLGFPLRFMPGLPRILGKSPKRFPSGFFYVPDKIFCQEFLQDPRQAFHQNFCLRFPPRFSARSLPGFLTQDCCEILSDSWHRFFQDLVLDSVKTWIASNWTKNIHITLDWFDRH